MYNEVLLITPLSEEQETSIYKNVMDNLLQSKVKIFRFHVKRNELFNCEDSFELLYKNLKQVNSNISFDAYAPPYLRINTGKLYGVNTSIRMSIRARDLWFMLLQYINVADNANIFSSLTITLVDISFEHKFKVRTLFGILIYMVSECISYLAENNKLDVSLVTDNVLRYFSKHFNVNTYVIYDYIQFVTSYINQDIFEDYSSNDHTLLCSDILSKILLSMKKEFDEEMFFIL